MSKEPTLAELIARIKEDLAVAEKKAYGDPTAGSVRPTISQAKAAFSRVGFSQEVDRL